MDFTEEVEADGSGEAVLLFEDTEATDLWPRAWSPDGKTLAFGSTRHTSDIWTLPLDDGENPGEPEAFLETAFYESGADFSPDGRWLAYHSDQSGRWEVYVRPYPKGEGQWLGRRRGIGIRSGPGTAVCCSIATVTG